LDEFIDSEVLKPLGMTDTFFAVPVEKRARLAALYKREPWDGSGNNVKYVTLDAGGSGIAENTQRKVYGQNIDGSGPAAPSSSVFLQSGLSSKVIQGGGCVCSIAGGLVSCLKDYARFSQMLVNSGQVDGIRVLQAESVQLLCRDWLNDCTKQKRKKPLWVWGTPGIGFSPLGQMGVETPAGVEANRRIVGSQLDTVHWGGAGGSGYMLNWPHQVVVLTYTGCAFDTATQKTMWRAAFGAIRRGGAKPVSPAQQKCDASADDTVAEGRTPKRSGKQSKRPSVAAANSPGSVEKQKQRSSPRKTTPRQLKRPSAGVVETESARKRTK